MKKIIIDKSKCIGCGSCVFISPKTFRVDKNAKAEVIDELSVSEKKLKEAIMICPVEAIKLKN